jgi:Kef-type K+ transport system membrane component KefB
MLCLPLPKDEKQDHRMQSSVHQTEILLSFTLLQLVVIILAARLAGAVAERTAQSRAVAEILAGLLLGPSLFGLLAPQTFDYVFRSSSPEPLTILSQVGLILLMFQIGLEFEFGHLRASGNRQAVLRIAAAGLALPFALGAAAGWISAPRLAPANDPVAYSLFLGTAFSITALPVLGRILLELGLNRTRIGVVAIGSAAVTDVVGWLLLAVVSALAVARFSAAEFAIRVALLAAYIAACWWIARPLLLRLLNRREGGPRPLGPDMVGVLIAAIFLSGMATFHLGVFAIFGGFMLGVLLHDQPAFVAAWREKVGGFVLVFFLPVFFTYTGLRTDIGGLQGAGDWGWCLLLVALATAGKFCGCYVAARRSGLDAREARAIGIMMNTRGLMELVVLNVGLDLGVIPPSVFTMLVIMAVVSNVITTPALRFWLRGQSAAPVAAAR